MKKKYIGYTLLPVLAVAFLGVNIASAHGFGFGMTKATPEEIVARQQEMFTHQANLLGISVDDVKNAWAKGQPISELAKEKGISEEQLRQKIAEQHKQQLQAHLQALVAGGVITQAQAENRLKFMESKTGTKMMKRGFHHGIRF
jgi:hypothetical protein